MKCTTRAASSLVAPLALALLGLAGCEGVLATDIDRTQPNKIRKSVLEGDWYFAQTVVGAPYTTTFTFIGETSERTERVRWDIQEQFLIAYRTYDLVAATDHASAQPGDHVENTPLAIFPIQSHFDIVRQYEPSTGEQSNVLMENDFDRPWYERDYLRVDWSQNLAANFNFLVEEVSQVPGAHFVQEPGDPDALTFGTRSRTASGEEVWTDHQGDAIAALEKAEYFDVVHRLFVTPETFLVEDWDGTVYEEPACWYYTNSDCASAEVTIRSSFLKVPATDTYLPKDYPDNEVLRDENGEPIRVFYSGEDVQSLVPDPEGFIARAPYFDKFGYFRTERERYDRRYGETQTGRIFLINRFDIWENEEACVTDTAPTHAACAVKPIVYYLSQGFPADLRDTASAIIEEWNRAFQEVVRARKYGDDRPLDDMEDVVVLRDNTFAIEGGKVVDRGQRYGDLRYNLFAWVDHANASGLLGYGPAQTDPLTGRIVQASAYNYGAGIELYAQNGKNVIDLINDPGLITDIMDGADVSQAVYLQAARDPHPKQKTLQFVRDKVNTPRNKAIKQQGLQALERDGSWLRSRLAALRDSPFEERLMTDEIVRALSPGSGAGPGQTSAVHPRARPSSWMMGQHVRRERDRRQKLAMRNIMHIRSFDASVVGLAERLKDLPSDEIFATLRREVFRSTALHELGHAFGLRHNYEGSTDALNYHRDFWDLKGEGAEPLEAPDDAQLAAGLRELQYSSIMDYASRFSADLRGLGNYDKAAIAFGYGNLVQVFNQGQPDENLLEVYDLDVILRHWRHYTRYPDLFGGIEGMFDRRYVPYEDMVRQFKGETTWDLWEVPYRFCSDEYDGYSATCASYDEGADAYEIVENARRQYLQYFPLLSFARDRRYFNEWDYWATVQWRTWVPMLTQYQNWVFDAYFYEYDWDDFRANYDLDYYGIEDVPWAEAGDGGLAGAAGSRLLLDALAEVIAMPEPGSFAYDPLEDVMLLYSYGEEDDAELFVPFGQGRYTDSLWDVDSGYYFYDRLYMVGSFYDKLLALETAVSSDTYFLGVDTGAEVDRYAIGLALMFPEEIYKLVGGSAAEDYPVFAGHACQDGTYEAPRLGVADPPCGGGVTRVVDPSTSFTIELFSIFYGIAFMPAQFDLNFNDRIHIWIDGGPEEIHVTDPALLVTFTNPLNNRTYLTTRTNVPGAYHPGAALLERAQRFADAWVADPTDYNRYLLEALVLTIEDVIGTYMLFGHFYF